MTTNSKKIYVRVDQRAIEGLAIAERTMGFGPGEATRVGLRLLGQLCKADEEGSVVRIHKSNGEIETVRFI